MFTDIFIYFAIPDEGKPVVLSKKCFTYIMYNKHLLVSVLSKSPNSKGNLGN